ncbi:MAG: hypothetical protein ACRDH6_10315 [Actinomycetota bacterium]
MSETTAIRGARPRELPPPNRTYRKGRVCADRGCSTVISVYNKARYCWAHTPIEYPLVRGRRRSRKAA